jgi:hypothetical protein
MPSRRQVRMAKQKGTEEGPRVPLEQGTAPKGAGERQPKKHGSSRHVSKRMKLKKKRRLCEWGCYTYPLAPDGRAI